MPARKRARAEIEDEDDTPAPAVQPPSMLQRIRNMWEFASLLQYLFLFGKAIRAEEWDAEDLEDELLKLEESQRLPELALTMLKSFSSFRPLNIDTFEEDIRRRYDRKGSSANPFGYDEQPIKFSSLDAFTKIRVLQQLSIWTFNNPDRIREKMSERESEQTFWRMEPLGWDEDERAYFVLDDDRLYRRTDAPLPPEPEPKTKAKGKNAKKTRSAKKRRISRPVIESSPEATEEDQPATNGVEPHAVEQELEDDGFGGMKWELVSITLDEYTAFLDTIRRSRDPNAKALFKRITSTVLPTIEKRAEQLRQKEMRKLRELENLQKMATAKRSSRLAGKAEQRKAQEEAEVAERKRQDELEMAHREQAKQRKLEEDRESRMMTREQRLKDREVKRILHEEELKKLEQDKERADSDAARVSERHLKAEMEKKKRELELLAQEEDWTFDCAKCGMHGQNYDDGSHSIACDKCGVWQHSACHGIKQDQAERDDFHFVCTPCKRKAERASQPKVPPLKFKFSSSPPAEPRQPGNSGIQTQPSPSNGPLPPVGRFDSTRASLPAPTNGALANGHSSSPAPRQSPYQGHPLATAPQLTREPASPAATASFRYSLQHAGAASSPPPAAYSPPQQSWNHHHAQQHTQNGYRLQPSPNHQYAAPQLPPIASFSPQRPIAQNTAQHQAFPRPPSQGTAHAPSTTYARAPPSQSPPLSESYSRGGYPPNTNTYRPPVSPSQPGTDPHRTPVIPQSQMLHSAMRAPSGPSTSPPAPDYLSTPQYSAPRPSLMQTPLPAASISPLKQESPRFTPAPSLANSPPIVPPVTTLTPTYGNVQQHSPPIKKSSPPEQHPSIAPAAVPAPSIGGSNSTSG